jgi:radical SAM superfamily enzyme YgiQ (UPF0313 family)
MKVLLVYPRYPATFWSFRHALKFVSRKAAYPPLGLLTVAAMLPQEWQKKLVDTNVTSLNDGDIEWADYVFISAMAVQRNSALDVIARCRQMGRKTVAGGPLFTTGYEEFADKVDHLVLGEAEATLPAFVSDLARGCAGHIYTPEGYPDISTTPVPQWQLINMRHYAAMSVQYSRGCPFDCEFCDITVLNGHRPRTKSKEQLLREFDALYELGWRGSVFVVDDNFIGNKKKLKAEILPAIASWMKEKKYPFTLFTQASVNLADDTELIEAMVQANFNSVFIGIETVNEDSLAECGKVQNRNRDLVEAVRKLQRHGLQVQGGFVLGFDSDPPSIFENIINFIQHSGIVTAMVGLLNAPPGTKLYQRLKREKRLVAMFSGDNTDCSTNLIPKMGYSTLVNGYRKVMETIYSHKEYYERIKTFLKEYRPPRIRISHFSLDHIKAFLKSLWLLGIKEKGRLLYWRLLTWTLFKRPRLFPLSVTLAIYGYHFRKVASSYFSPGSQGLKQGI